MRLHFYDNAPKAIQERDETVKVRATALGTVRAGLAVLDAIAADELGKAVHELAEKEKTG